MFHLTIACVLQMNGFLWINLHDTILYRVLNLSQHIVAIAVNNLNKLTHFTPGIGKIFSFTFCNTFLLIIARQCFC